MSLGKRQICDMNSAIILHHNNGNKSSSFYGYFSQSDIPVIDFGLKNEYDKTNWAILDFSSEEIAGENGRAINIIDGNQDSYWHSRWSSNAAAYPHFLTVDMQQALASKAFTLSQRGGMRKVKDIELLISSDNNTWESLGHFILRNYGGQQVINLSTIKTFRYFKIIMNTAHDGQQFAALAETGVIKD